MNNLFDKFNIKVEAKKQTVEAPKKGKNEPYAKIIFRFENDEDFKEFQDLIGQKITNTKDNIWFPKRLYNPNKVKVIGDVKKAPSVLDLLKK